MNTKDKTIIILLVVVVIILSVYIIIEGFQRNNPPIQSMTQDNTPQISGAGQLSSQADNSYMYENMEPGGGSVANYFSVYLEFPGANFHTYGGSKITSINFSNSAGKYGADTITDMELPPDFCTNDTYRDERLKLFPYLSTGLDSIICLSSNPPSTYRVSSSYNLDGFGNNVVNTVGGTIPELMLPMVIGKYYVQVEVEYKGSEKTNSAGEQADITKVLDPVLADIVKSFQFSPYYSQ